MQVAGSRRWWPQRWWQHCSAKLMGEVEFTFEMMYVTSEAKISPCWLHPWRQVCVLCDASTSCNRQAQAGAGSLQYAATREGGYCTEWTHHAFAALIRYQSARYEKGWRNGERSGIKDLQEREAPGSSGAKHRDHMRKSKRLYHERSWPRAGSARITEARALGGDGPGREGRGKKLGRVMDGSARHPSPLHARRHAAPHTAPYHRQTVQCRPPPPLDAWLIFRSSGPPFTRKSSRAWQRRATKPSPNGPFTSTTAPLASFSITPSERISHGWSA